LTFADSSKVSADDRLLVFFAGHGHTTTGSRGEVGFLVPVDGDPTQIGTLLRNNDWWSAAVCCVAVHANSRLKNYFLELLVLAGRDRSDAGNIQPNIESGRAFIGFGSSGKRPLKDRQLFIFCPPREQDHDFGIPA